MRRLLSLMAALALLVGACGDGDSDDDLSAGTTVPDATSTTLPDGEGDPDDVAEPVGELQLGELRSPDFPGTNEVALLTDIRVAGHGGFDRVVFEFEEGAEAPAWLAGHRQPPIEEDPSGRAIEVEGQAFLSITMSAASAVELSGEDFRQTFEPDRVAGDGASMVTEVVDAGDFEATMTWVIGLRSQQPFAVTTFSDPTRVVVDIATGQATG